MMKSYSMKDVKRFAKRRMGEYSDRVFYEAYDWGQEDSIDWNAENATSREMVKDDVRDHFPTLTKNQLGRIDAFIEGLH